MKAGTKFAVGAGIIVLSVAALMAQGVKQFGQYSLKPTELAARAEADPAFYDTGVKMEAKVVPGTIKRDAATQTIDFVVSDGGKQIPVTYRGLAPDTFTDQMEIEVVVEGRYGRDGVFHATTLLAKCGSRYEAQYNNQGKPV
ncbi:MAG: cytochrome c maturation protein CcmE [Gemmatimonadetes bacterium]|nr:cytochrome c maturation protein CcmE [Gemmatimonadota bacterium]